MTRSRGMYMENDETYRSLFFLKHKQIYLLTKEMTLITPTLWNSLIVFDKDNWCNNEKKKRSMEIFSLNWACSSLQLISVKNDDGIFTLLFHRPRVQVTLFMMHATTNFPSLSFLVIVLSFPSHSWCWTNVPSVKLQTVWVFLPSAVVSSDFSPSLQESCVVFKVLSVFMLRKCVHDRKWQEWRLTF